MRRWLDPFAVRVDVGEDFDGADDRIGGDGDAVGFVNDAAQRAADVVVAFGEQAGGVGVTVNGAPVDVIVVGDLIDVFPVDEGVVDFVLNVSAADAALLLVAREAGLGRWCGLRFLCARAPLLATAGFWRARADFDYGRGSFLSVGLDARGG